jgi:hypothetical protein
LKGKTLKTTCNHFLFLLEQKTTTLLPLFNTFQFLNTMGAAASVQTELGKPLDCSDLATKEEAVKEVVRLRSLLLSTTKPEPTEDIPVVTFSPEAFRKAAAAGNLLTVKAHVSAAGKEDITLINQGNIDLETALHLAAAAGHSSVVNCLVQASAQLDLKDDYGFTPMRHIAGAPASKLTEGHVKCARILCQANADANVVCDYGWTPLMKCCEMGHLELVKIFCLESNVDINKTENGGESALDKATDKEHLDIVEFLKSKGAKESASEE